MVKLKNKLKEWFKRYAAAELIGLVFALVFSNLSMLLFGNIILSGFIGTWAENLGFYGTITLKDLQKKRKKYDKQDKLNKKLNRKLNIKNYLILFRNLIIEFGPAEYFDSFLIRPFYLSFFPYIFSNYSLAIFIGTSLANITYYLPTIISYELRKKIFKE